MTRRVDRLRGVPVWVDCGRGDPFTEIAERTRGRMPSRPAGGLFGGCRDGPYWMRRAPAHLGFLGRHRP